MKQLLKVNTRKLSLQAAETPSRYLIKTLIINPFAGTRVHLQREQQPAASGGAVAARAPEPGERRGVPGGGGRDAARVQKAGRQDGGRKLPAGNHETNLWLPSCVNV